MPRPNLSVPPEAIRIEDEVWQEAFARIEAPSRRRLQAIDGGRAQSTRVPPRRAATATLTPPASGEAQPAAPSTPRIPPPRSWSDYPRVRSSSEAHVAERRTVVIRGYGAERNLPWPDASRRRPQRPLYERSGFRPDRLAMWAVLLGVLLLVVAVASSHS